MTTSDLLGTQQRRYPQHEQRIEEEPSVGIVREDIYALLTTRETMGFVERVGNVFVALHGPDLARAVEVGQSLSWDESVKMVTRAYRARG
jgi:hypothetical protein